MTSTHTPVSAKADKRARRRDKAKRQAAQPRDGNLLDALNHLHNAIHDLTAPQPRQTDQGTHWLPNRYTTLRQALYSGRDCPGGTGPHSIPAWIDALKLLIEIDASAAGWLHAWPSGDLIDGTEHPTVRRIRQVPNHSWRPQDSRNVLDISTEMGHYAQAVDDLFAPKPIYLPDPCPHCRQTHTFKLSDDGSRIRVPALSLTVEHGATCAACHDRWQPAELIFLGKLLGYQKLEGVIA